MPSRKPTAEQIIGRLAARSHGVVTRRALTDAGLTNAEIQHRLATGALLREHRGVFRVGHRAPSLEATFLAAVLACGERALLSGSAAAHLYGLVKGTPPAPEVTTPGRRRVRGVRIRQTRALDGRDATVFRGIPITTVARVLVDLARELSAYDLGRACHEAGVRYRTTPRDVESVLARRPNSPGAARIRRIAGGDEPIVLSRLEQRFVALLRRHGLPLPKTNRPAGGRRVDCRWDEPPLTIELDSYTYHRSRHAWEADRRREREARARGDDFRRYTYGDVYEDSPLMIAELHRLLGRCRNE